MPSLWIQHVKSYARQYNIPYKEALKLAKPSYSKFGTVSTEPSHIKLKLNDEQYNLNTVAIKPTFKKGSTETHIVNIKYNSDEAIKIPPNPLVPNIVENIEVIPPNPLVPNIEELQEYIPQNKQMTPQDYIAELQNYNIQEATTPAVHNYKNYYDNNIKALKSQFETAQNKKHYDSNIKALKSQFETQKELGNEIEHNNKIIKINQQKIYNPYQKPKRQNNFKEEEQNNIYNVEGIIEPKTPIKKIDYDPLGVKGPPKFERLEKTHPLYEYYDILTEQGIIPFDFIETPQFKGRDDQIKFLKKLLEQHANLMTRILKSKLPEDDKIKLEAECNANIFEILDKIKQIEELKKLEDIEIAQKNKKPINKELSAKELLKSKDPLSLLKNDFTTLGERTQYYSDLYRKINKEMEKWVKDNDNYILENNPYYKLKIKIFNFQHQKQQKEIAQNKQQKEIAQNKQHYDSNIKALKSKFETQKQQREIAQNKKNYDSNIKALKSKILKSQIETQKQQREIAKNKKHYNSNINALKSQFETQKQQREIAKNKQHYDSNIKALKSKFENATNKEKEEEEVDEDGEYIFETFKRNMDFEPNDDLNDNEKVEELNNYISLYFFKNGNLKPLNHIIQTSLFKETQTEKRSELIEINKDLTQIIAISKDEENDDELDRDLKKRFKIIRNTAQQYRKEIEKIMLKLGNTEEDIQERKKALKDAKKALKAEAEKERLYKEQEAEKQRIKFEKYKAKKESKKI